MNISFIDLLKTFVYDDERIGIDLLRPEMVSPIDITIIEFVKAKIVRCGTNIDAITSIKHKWDESANL